MTPLQILAVFGIIIACCFVLGNIVVWAQSKPPAPPPPLPYACSCGCSLFTYATVNFPESFYRLMEDYHLCKNFKICNNCGRFLIENNLRNGSIDRFEFAKEYEEFFRKAYKISSDLMRLNDAITKLDSPRHINHMSEARDYMEKKEFIVKRLKAAMLFYETEILQSPLYGSASSFMPKYYDRVKRSMETTPYRY